MKREGEESEGRAKAKFNEGGRRVKRGRKESESNVKGERKKSEKREEEE